MNRLLICWTVSFSLVFNSIGVAWAGLASGTDSVQPRERSASEIESAVDTYLRLAKELRSQIDRSQFDTDALLAKLDYDSKLISVFVREKIGFEPYRGLLRGPAGTLMARSGNSLDQSVLLAKLLNDAGYEARITQGILSEYDIDRLLAVVKPQPRYSSAFADEESAKAVFREMASIVEMPSSQVEQKLQEIFNSKSKANAASRLRKAAKLEAEAIINVLRESDIKLGGEGLVNEIRAEVGEYYWVQYRDGNSDWIDLHPAFGSAKEPEAEADAYFKNEVPAELQHRIRIQAHLLRVVGNSIETTTLMPPWVRPAANLAHRSITYTHSPLRLPEGMDEPWQYLGSGETFVPVLDGAIASENAFDLSGNVVPMMAVQAAGADLFKTLSDKGRVAESALSALGESGETKRRRFGISEVRLEISLISPAGDDRTFTRVIYDPCTDHRPLPDNEPCFPDEASVDDKLALTRTNALAVSVGEIPESYVLDRTLERLIDSEAFWKLQIDPVKRQDLKAWLELELGDTSWLGFLPLFLNFDSSGNEAHVYRATPSVVLFQQTIGQDNQYAVSLDVLTNKKVGLLNNGGTITNNPGALVYEGVWETGAEFYFFTGDQDEAAQLAFPLSLSDDKNRTGRAVSNAEALPSWGRQVMEGAVNTGYSVIVAGGADPSQSGQVAWYRVNPVTGETLGMNAEGRGGLLEYLGKAVLGLMIIAPAYFLGCKIAGYDIAQCVMFARTVAVFGLGAVTFAIALLTTIVFWPVDAH